MRRPIISVNVRRSGNENGSPSLSAASAQPRSGSGVLRKYSTSSRSLALRLGLNDRRSSSAAKAFTAASRPLAAVLAAARPVDLPRRSCAPVFLVAKERQRPPALAHEADLMHQRVLAAVRHPDLFRLARGDGGDQPRPVAVIGDHQRQLDALL